MAAESLEKLVQGNLLRQVRGLRLQRQQLAPKLLQNQTRMLQLCFLLSQFLEITADSDDPCASWRRLDSCMEKNAPLPSFD